MNQLSLILFVIILFFSSTTLLEACEDSPGPGDTPIILDAREVSITELAECISEQIDGTLSLHGDIIATTVSLTVENEPLNKVLNQITTPQGWVWWAEDNGDFGISDRKFYERNLVCGGHLPIKVFRLQNITASKAKKEIEHLITPNRGVAVGDNRINKLIIIDTPKQQKVIEQYLRELDNSPWRVFTIDYWQLKKNRRRK